MGSSATKNVGEPPTGTWYFWSTNSGSAASTSKVLRTA
nr:MAG TPA: hypothetical protein [Bacteriophage sp.]